MSAKKQEGQGTKQQSSNPCIVDKIFDAGDYILEELEKHPAMQEVVMLGLVWWMMHSRYKNS